MPDRGVARQRLHVLDVAFYRHFEQRPLYAAMLVTERDFEIARQAVALLPPVTAHDAGVVSAAQLARDYRIMLRALHPAQRGNDRG